MAKNPPRKVGARALMAQYEKGKFREDKAYRWQAAR
jgi:hypothetical protein